MTTTATGATAAVDTATELLPGVHWVGAFDPGLRSFDIILKTANGTSYNAYAVRGSEGVAVIDTVKEEFADEFFRRLESVARYDEIRAIVLNHLEPDHTGALPELLRRAPQATLYISTRAQAMLKGLLGGETLAFTAVTTGDRLSLGDRSLSFLQTPYLHWPDTQCTYLNEVRVLFSGDVFGCHFCDTRLFDDVVGDFRFSFDYYYAHIMRPFGSYVREALALIEPLPVRRNRSGAWADPAYGTASLRRALPELVGGQPLWWPGADVAGVLHLRLRQHPAHGRGGRGRRRNGRRRARIALRSGGRRGRALRRPH